MGRTIGPRECSNCGAYTGEFYGSNCFYCGGSLGPDPCPRDPQCQLTTHDERGKHRCKNKKMKDSDYCRVHRDEVEYAFPSVKEARLRVSLR